MNFRKVLSITITVLFLGTNYTLAGAPSVMTFQSKIISPSGTALEAASVNFRFTVLDTTGTCILYVEDYANINMTGSQGVVAIPLGSGTKTYPPAAVSLYEVFNNSTANFNCQAGGTVSPTATDNRQVVMQFNDGSGWQTLPQMAINAVPFANYATRAEALGSYPAANYLRPATLPTCTASQALTWDGTTFTCLAAGGGGGSTYTGVTSIANASGDITLAPAAGTGAVLITSNTPSTSTTTGAVVITGGMGVSGAINAAGNITTSGSVSSVSMLSTTSVYTPQLYGTSTASGDIKVDGTSNATKGNVLLASAGGNVGIGTTTPSYPLQIYANGDNRFYVESDGGTRVKIQDASSKSFIVQYAANDVLKANHNSLTLDLWSAAGQPYTIATGIYPTSLSIKTTTSAPITFGTNNFERMRIDSTGNIGIGTTSPTYALSVSGDINVTGNFRVNGTVLSGGGGGANQTGVQSISNASGDITLAPAVGTGAVQINSGAASTSPTTGALIVSGGVGVSGGIYSGGEISSGSTVSANTSMFTPQLYGTSTPSGDIKIDGTSNATKGNVLLSSAGGNVRVGSGTFDPNFKFQTNAYPTLTSGSSAAIFGANYPSYSSSSSAAFRGVHGYVDTTSTGSNGTSALTGVYGEVFKTGVGIGVDQINGLESNVFRSEGNVTDINGTYNNVYSGASQSATTVRGTMNAVMVSSGSQDIYGSYNSILQFFAGNSTNAYGVYSEIATSGGGATISKSYGVYTGPIQGTNKWSFYASDSNAPSYFAGKVGVGTTSPAYALSVSGDVNVSGNFRINGTILSTAGGTNQTGVQSIANASGDISLSPAVSTGAVRVTSGAASTSPTTGALIVDGGIGLSGSIYTGEAISSGSSVYATTSIFSPQLYGTSTASGDIKVDGTSNATKGNVLLASTGGNVGIGTTSPKTNLHIVNGGPSGGTYTGNERGFIIDD